MAYKARKMYKPKLGVDLKSAETMRGEDHLSFAQNVCYDQQGNLTKRPGTHLRVYGVTAYSGMTLFETTDYKGVSKSEVVFLGQAAGTSPMRLIKRNVNVANGSGATVVCSVVYNATLARYEMIFTGGATATINLGTGLVGGDLTVAGLVATVVAGITFTAPSAIGTVPAAFLEVKSETIPNGGSANFEYYSAEEIFYGGSSAEPSFTPVFPVSNPVSVNINGSLYWYPSHTGADGMLLKYDGQAWYKAGLPKVEHALFPIIGPVPATLTDVKGTRAYTFSTFGANWRALYARLVYKDKAGALHYGDFSAPSGLFQNTGAATIYALNLPTATAVTNENARGAVTTNVAQNLVTTINVVAGHTLVAGDVAYFWNVVAGQFVEREILSVTAGSITISTAVITPGDSAGVVSVYADATISNNFRTQWFDASEDTFIDRYKMLSGELVAEVPFGILGTSSIFYESSAATLRSEYGVSIAENYQFDGADQFPPVAGRFVASTNNGSSLLISGNDESDNTIYSSTALDPEAFYLGRNSFTVDGKVTGLGSSGATAFISTSKQTYAVQGDIPNLNFRVEKVTENLGVIAPASIVEVDEGAIHFNTIKGPFLLLGGRELKPVGEWPMDKRVSIVEPYFTYPYPPRNATTYAPSFEVASAYVIREKKWIILNTPWNASSLYSFALSPTWVYDYSMGGWFLWAGIDASCGSVYWDGKVWMAGQGAASTCNVVSMVEPTSDQSFTDHGTAITSVIRTHWESGGDMNIYKKFLWLTLYTPPGNSTPYNLDVSTFVNYEVAPQYALKIPTAQHTSYTITATPPAYTVETKLKNGKFASLCVQISNNVNLQGLWLGGMELDIAPTYAIPSRPGRGDR